MLEISKYYFKSKCFCHDIGGLAKQPQLGLARQNFL
jgi:hypothetical protein